MIYLRCVEVCRRLRLQPPCQSEPWLARRSWPSLERCRAPSDGRTLSRGAKTRRGSLRSGSVNSIKNLRSGPPSGIGLHPPCPFISARWMQIALKPASKGLGLRGVFMRCKGLKDMIADRAFKLIQVDVPGACWLDADEHHRSPALRTGGAPNCSERIDGRCALRLGHEGFARIGASGLRRTTKG
jgi:hypothetical protein